MSEQPNVKATHIDLMEMARFLVLPGAVELLEAFARIPPGRLRESVISHAEVIAQEYSNAPLDQQMPDPLYMASQRVVTPPPKAAKALPGPPKRKPQTQEEEIVKLRLEGLNKHQIMAQTGAKRQAVEAVLKAARKAGLQLPPAMPGDMQGGTRFTTSLDDLSAQGRSNMELAAVRYGHSLESWMEARATLVAMRLAQKPMDEISAAIRPKLPDKMLWGWLYTARRAGIELPLEIADDAVVEPVAQDAPQKAATAPKKPLVIPAPGKPVFTPLEQMEGSIHAGGLKAIRDAAAARGLTPQAYFDLRESIILHRWAGKGFTEIYSIVGQDMDFVRNTIANARQKGVEFPPITSDFDAAGWTRANPVTRQIGTGRSGFRKDVPTPVILPATDNRVFPPPKQAKPDHQKEFPLRVEDCGKGILASVVREGLAKGQTLEDYFAMRRKAVELFRQGHTCSHVAKVVGIKKKQSENWRFRARKAGHLPDTSKLAAE